MAYFTVDGQLGRGISLQTPTFADLIYKQTQKVLWSKLRAAQSPHKVSTIID
jgi:hypothetical protein